MKESVLNIVLTVSRGEAEGVRYHFSEKRLIVGSGPSANLKLEDPSVSNIHAILKSGDEPCTASISDLGSETGTCLNGREIKHEMRVRRGDRLTMGVYELEIIGIDDDAVETKIGPPPTKSAASTKSYEPKEAEKAVVTTRKKQACAPTRQQGITSGQNFMDRESHRIEKPVVGNQLLEVKVAWGHIAFDVRQMEMGGGVTVGDHPQATMRLQNGMFEGELFTLLSPKGNNGHVVNVADGMGFEVKRDGKKVEVDRLPSKGAIRTYPLEIGDKCRVMMGQLAFIIQYVSPAMGIQSGKLASLDERMGRWFLLVLVLALGMWGAIETTPKFQVEASDYLKNPARWADLIMPKQSQDKKKKFDEIKKRNEEKAIADDGKWKKVTAQSKANTKEIPRDVKEKIDRKVATTAGILGLLQGRGGGTGDNASSVFGGSALSSLDQSLASLQTSGMDSGGFGGMGTRGGGPGGGGGGLGLGGLGTSGYGRGSGSGYGSVNLGHREKSTVQVVKGTTKVIGGLSQEVVGRYIQRYYAQIKFCYERELTKNPNLYGKVAVTFTIAGNGRVSEAQVIQTSMHNPNCEECILRVIRRMVFPTPQGGGQVIVTYPFLFTLAG
jgi:TonB family protein